jgi:hypothetical protein
MVLFIGVTALVYKQLKMLLLRKLNKQLSLLEVHIGIDCVLVELDVFDSARDRLARQQVVHMLKFFCFYSYRQPVNSRAKTFNSNPKRA